MFVLQCCCLAFSSSSLHLFEMNLLTDDEVMVSVNIIRELNQHHSKVCEFIYSYILFLMLHSYEVCVLAVGAGNLCQPGWIGIWSC